MNLVEHLTKSENVALQSFIIHSSPLLQFSIARIVSLKVKHAGQLSSQFLAIVNGAKEYLYPSNYSLRGAQRSSVITHQACNGFNTYRCRERGWWRHSCIPQSPHIGGRGTGLVRDGKVERGGQVYLQDGLRGVY